MGFSARLHFFQFFLISKYFFFAVKSSVTFFLIRVEQSKFMWESVPRSRTGLGPLIETSEGTPGVRGVRQPRIDQYSALQEREQTFWDGTLTTGLWNCIDFYAYYETVSDSVGDWPIQCTWRNQARRPSEAALSRPHSRRYSMVQQRAEPSAQFPLQGHRCASEVTGVSYDIMYWYLCNTMSPLHAILIFLSKTR